MLVKDKIKSFVAERYLPNEYPSLEQQALLWGGDVPFLGLRFLDCTPVFANTLAKYIPLLEGGATLCVGISDKLPYDKSVVEFLKSIGIEVITPQCVEQQFDLVLDCGAVFSAIESSIGYVELTRSGVEKYKMCQKPVFLADSGRVKRIETMLGTGESYFRAMDLLGYNQWQGKRLLLFGSGKVGSGIIFYAALHGAIVTVVTEPESLAPELNKYIEQVVDCRDSSLVHKLITESYAVVSATGVKGASSCYADTLDSSTAIIANMGIEDEFGDQLSCQRVLNGKKPLNFILSEPTHLKYIEATMALHNQGAFYLCSAEQPSGMVLPPETMERQILETTRRCGLIAKELAFLD
ncbi:MAG: hypothetical protein RR931_01965 [Mucinivorans sp.]